MGFTIAILVIGTAAFVLLLPLWALRRAGEARRKVASAKERMDQLELIIKGLRAELEALRAARDEAPAEAEGTLAAFLRPVHHVPLKSDHRPAPPHERAHHQKHEPPHQQKKHQPRPLPEHPPAARAQRHAAPGDAAAELAAVQAQAVEAIPVATIIEALPVEPLLAASTPVKIEAPVIIEALPFVPAPMPPKARATRPGAAAPLPPRGSEAEAKAAVAAYSAWSETLRPLLLENLPWFVGGFLVIAGSLYFIREAWGAFAAVGRHVLAVSVLLAYAAGFVGVGLWLKKQKPLASASRAMSYVGLSLLPVAFLELADLFAGSGAHLAYAVLLPLSVAASYPVLYLAAGLLDRPLARPLATALCALLALIGLVPLLRALSPQAAFALPYVAWAVVHAASAAPLRAATAPSTATIAFHLSALAYALAFVVGLTQVLAGSDPGAPPLPAAYGPLAALLSLTAVRVDVELRARWKGTPEVDAAVVAAFAVTLGGVAASWGQPALFALSSALGAALFAVALRWYRRPLLLIFGIGCGAASTAALLFLVPPLASLRQMLGDATAAAGLLSSEPGAWAFLVLPLAEGTSRLAARYRARGELRLSRAAEQARWLLLAAIAAFSFFNGYPPAPGVTLLATAALLCAWHWRTPRERTAWTGAVALGAGALLDSAGVTDAFSTSLLIAAAALLVSASPGLSGKGARPGSSALLVLALAASAWALAVSGGAATPHFLAALALLATTAALAAYAFGSALPGLVAAAAASALVANALFGRGFASALPAPSALWLALPALQCAAVIVLRKAASRLPRRERWKVARAALPARARGLHALSEPLLALTWLTTLALAAVALTAQGLVAAALLAGASALFVAAGKLSRAPAGAWLAAAAFTAAGAFAAPVLLVDQSALPLGAAAAALVAFAATSLLDRKGFATLRSRKASSLRSLGTALLLAARGAALLPLAFFFIGAPLLPRDLAVAAGVFALAAVLVSSAASGLVAALAGSLLFAVLVFGQQAALDLFGRPDARWLALLAGQIALGFALRLSANKLRGARPRPLGPISLPRARSLHALSESLLPVAWLTAASIFVRGVVARDGQGALSLAAVGAAALVLGALGRKKNVPGAIAAISFTAAGALFALANLDGAPAAAILGAVLAASAVAALAPLGRGSRRLSPALGALRSTGYLALALATVAALAALAPVAGALVGWRVQAASRLIHLTLALLSAAPALIALRRKGDPSGEVLAVLALAGACVAGVPALGFPGYDTGTALAALAVAMIWAERLTRGQQGLGGAVAASLRWGAPLVAILALFAGFLPASETFAAPLRQVGGLHLGHIPTDLLLVAFLLSALAARGGPVFLHLLFAEAIILASRVRLSLGIPTRGHGMILAGGALLALAISLRKKPRYSFATLLWCAAALYAGVARMLFGGAWGYLPVDTQEWAWALAGALLAVPLARFFFSKVASAVAAACLAASLLAGAAQLFPDWFTRGWPVATAAVALVFAAFALGLRKLDDARAFFCAREHQASAFRGASAILAAGAGGFAALIAGGAALRISSPLTLPMGAPLALTLALAAASAFLVTREQKPAFSLPLLVAGGALAICSVASPLLAPLLGAAAPVVVLSALALLANALSSTPSLRADLGPGAIALWGAALIATRANSTEWTTGAALAAGALVLRNLSSPPLLAGLPVATGFLLAGAGCALSWAAGFSPLASDIGVLAGVGVLALLAAFGHELSAGKLGRVARVRSTALVLLGSAMLLVAALLSPPWARSSSVAIGAVICASLLALRAVGRGALPAEPYALDLALAALGSVYLLGRARLNLGAGVDNLDRNAVLSAALLLVGVERAVYRRRPDLARSLTRGSALLPLALLPVALGAGLANIAAGGGLLYGLLAWLHRSRRSAYAALALANIFFFATWQQNGIVDAQLYTIPLGLSLLLAAQLSRKDLKGPSLQLLRGLGCLMLYAGTAWQMVGSDQLLLPLVLCGLALATVVLGVLLQVRAFAYLGTATLVVTVLANLVRFGTRSKMVMAVSATLTGIIILTGWTYLNVRKEQALELYRRMVRGMEDWD